MTLSLPRLYHGLHGEIPLWLNSEVCPVLAMQVTFELQGCVRSALFYVVSLFFPGCMRC